ncbi:MAG: hypothetical protein WA220_01245 [Candidatus Nitrosopolaris sp.]
MVILHFTSSTTADDVGAKDHYQTTEFVSGLLGKKDKNKATTLTYVECMYERRLAIKKLTKANS